MREDNRRQDRQREIGDKSEDFRGRLEEYQVGMLNKRDKGRSQILIIESINQYNNYKQSTKQLNQATLFIGTKIQLN